MLGWKGYSALYVKLSVCKEASRWVVVGEKRKYTGFR